MAVVLDYAPKPQKQLIWLPTFAAAALFWLIFPLLCWQTRATVDEFGHLMNRPLADEDAWFRAELERRVWILEWRRNPDHPPVGRSPRSRSRRP